MELEGKAVLITGGAGGLGAAMATTLRQAGARVVIHDRQADRGTELARRINATSGGAPARFVAGDLGDLAASRAQALALDAEVGGFFGLVNNAAVVPLKPLGDYTLDEYEAIQRVNAHAAFVLAQALAPSMAARGGGAIVNVCSITLGGEWAHFVPYVTSKGALLGMTRALARELGPTGIRVNAVSPGPTKTARFQATRRVDPAKMDSSIKSFDRYAEPDEIADAVAFLAGPRSKFINGQVIRVDGGRSIV